MLQTSLRTSFGLPGPSGTAALGQNGIAAERTQLPAHISGGPPSSGSPGPRGTPALGQNGTAERGPLPARLGQSRPGGAPQVLGWNSTVTERRPSPEHLTVALLNLEARGRPHWQPPGYLGTVAKCIAVLGFVGVLGGAAYVLLITGLDASKFGPQTAEGKAAANKWWILTLVCMYSVWECFTTDQYLPNMPEMQADLGASYAQISASVGLISLVRGIVAFPIGLVSDHIGRRPVILFIFGMLPLSVIASGLAPDVEWFLAARVLNGISEGTCGVASSILRDTFDDPEERARATSVWLMVCLVAISLAPFVGGVLGVWIGWRAVFPLLVPGMGFCWLMLFLHLPETLVVHTGSEGSYWERAWQIVNYKSGVLLVNAAFQTYCYFAMLANGSLILEGTFGFTAVQTAVAMGCIALAVLVCTRLSDAYTQTCGVLSAYRAGVAVLLVPLGLCLLSAAFSGAWWLFMLAQLFYSLLFLMHAVAAEVCFMQPFPKVAGLAYALWQVSGYGLSNILVIGAGYILERSANKSRSYELLAALSILLVMVIATFGFALRPPDYVVKAQEEFEGLMATSVQSTGEATKEVTKPAAGALLSAM